MKIRYNRIGSERKALVRAIEEITECTAQYLGAPTFAYQVDYFTIEKDGAEIKVSRPNDLKENRSLHGLTRTLIANMIEGVNTGFKKELEINGIGYRAEKKGSDLVMKIGYSHDVIVPEIDGITIDVPAPNKIVISGADKQKVGQFAAEVREKRPPEPYKGKGIKYADEHIRRKEGKAGKGK